MELPEGKMRKEIVPGRRRERVLDETQDERIISKYA